MLSLPILLLIGLVICGWIRCVSPGTVFYRQRRIGKGGKPFEIFKFRTMHMDAGTEEHVRHVRELIRSGRPLIKLDQLGDARLIPGARIIRAFGLDELPQLFNVIRGEMSLVGPRPCLPEEYWCGSAVGHPRFSVEPGVTGAWQVHRGSRSTFDDMLALDRSYIDRMNLWTDLGIILQTPVSIASGLPGSLRRTVPSRSVRANPVPDFRSGSVSFERMSRTLNARHEIE